MRLWFSLLMCLMVASCDSMPVLWHRPTQEEKDRAAREEQKAGAERRRQQAEDQRKLDSVIQAFSLQDVSHCKRLGLMRYQTLDGARIWAVKMGGNRILAQRRWSYYRDHHARGVDDFEIYLCPSPTESPR